MGMSEFLCYYKATKRPVFSVKESNTDMKESVNNKAILQEGKVFPFVCE